MSEGVGSGVGPVHFCSAEKGGLFFGDQPAILTGAWASAERDAWHGSNGVGWEQREEGHDLVQPAVQAQQSREEDTEGTTHFNKHTLRIPRGLQTWNSLTRTV